jgi:hypothetical protein
VKNGKCSILKGIAVLAVAATAGASSAAQSAFFNPGFEDVSKRGTINEHAEIGPWGVNGNGGLLVRPVKGRYVWEAPFDESFDIVPGQPYAFSCDMLHHGDAATVTAVQVLERKTGKYHSGFWGEVRTKQDNGWTRHETKFIPKISGRDPKYRYQFIIFTQVSHGKPLGPENYSRVDNLSIRRDKPEWEICNVWPTHFKIFTERARVRFSTNFVGPYLPEGRKPAYRAVLKKADGEVLAKDAAQPDKNGVFTVDFGKLAYKGAVKLSVTFADDAGHEYETRTFDLAATETYKPRKGEIFVQENGVPVVDGKPFLAMGIYCNSVDPCEQGGFGGKEDGLRECKELGFNLLYDYGTYKLRKREDRQAHYARVAKYGLRTLADDFSRNNASDNLSDPGCRTRTLARELASYPAVIGFYTMDEAGPETIPPLTVVRRVLNEEAPGHIVTTCNIFSPFTYLSTADVQGGDKYPIDAGERADLTDMDNYGAKLAATSALGWHAPQIINWGNTRRHLVNDPVRYRKESREPMENEMLSVALMYASWGVKGFAFYSYFDMYRGPIPEWIPLRRERVRNVVADLWSLEPFILSGEPIEEVPHDDIRGKTRIVALSDGKGAYRVLVIGVKRDNACTFALPAKYGRLRPRKNNVKFADGLYSFASKEFTCDILE